MKESESGNKSSSYWPLFWAGLVVVLVWLAAWFFIPRLIPDPEIRGQFGDMFGVVNALFSGLAFAGIIFTILLQKSELELQRKEMRDTRDVLESQKDQLEIQNNSIKRQVFEASFFNLLKTLQGSALKSRTNANQILAQVDGFVIESMLQKSKTELEAASELRKPYEPEVTILRKYLLDKDDREETKELREALLEQNRIGRDISQELLNHIGRLKRIDGWIEAAYTALSKRQISITPEEINSSLGPQMWKSLNTSQKLRAAQDAYKKLNEYDNAVLRAYFLLLHSVLAFIDNSEFSDSSKAFYTGILHAHLSNSELAIILLRSISEAESDDLQKYVEKYDLLKSLHMRNTLGLTDWKLLWYEKFPPMNQHS